MASPDHKRRWTENNPGMSIPSRPPLKKRFTSNVNIATTTTPSSSTGVTVVTSGPASASDLVPSPISTSPTTTSTATAATVTTTPITTTATMVTTTRPYLEDVETISAKSLSKNAWLKRMNEAKRDYNDLDERKTTFENEYINNEATRGLIRVQLNMIQQDLILVAKSKFVVDITTQTDPPKETGKAEREWLEKTHLMAKELQTMILDYIKSWTEGTMTLEKIWHQESDTSRKHMLLSNWLQREMEDLQRSYQQAQTCLHYTNQEQQRVNQQTNDIIKETQATADELERIKEELDECTMTLMQTEKRHERSKSKVVASLANGGLGDLTVDALDNAPTTPTSVSSSSASTTAVMPAPVSSSSTVAAKGYSDSDIEPGSIADQTMKSQLSEHQLIVDTRNKELSDLKLERQTLADDIDRLRIQFSNIPDERLVNTDYYKNLQTSYEYYRHRAHHLDQMRTNLDRTLDDLARTRKRWVDELKSERTTQNATMESEMKRLENDLIRIRGQKDQFQSHYDEQVSKELKLKETNQQILDLATEQKEYIISLESRLHDLKSEATVAGPLTKDLKQFEEIRMSLKQTKYSLERLQEMEQGWNTNDSQQHITSMKDQITRLRNQLELWKTDGGGNNNAELHDRIQALMKELSEYSMESQKLSLMIDLFEKTETRLLEEIDRMASIYGRLEEQRSKKVFDDDYKQDHKLKLLAEKSKYAQTFPSLMAAKEKQQANVTSLRLTCDKQKELITQLKEHEKSLELQLSGKEYDSWRMTQSVEDDKSMVESLTQQLEESKNTLEQLDEHMMELQKVLKEKTRALEEEKHLQSRVEEDHDKMKRKWDMISHGDNPQEQQLAEECDELRSLLKCGTCRTRFRSHLLTRCMHTFCKKCIDARLETRQRRCPTCGESFGASDVRQFYL